MKNKEQKTKKDKLMGSVFIPSKYGSMEKITDFGNKEFLENYLTEYLDKQVTKYENVPVLRKQMEPKPKILQA